MEPIDVALLLLLLHALLGAVDTFYNHEWIERLPQRRDAGPELRLHAWRSLVFVVLFLGAAWLEWHGAWSAMLPALIALEYVITVRDSLEEDRYRVLTPLERINHMLLELNTGAYAALICWQAWTVWRPLPPAVTFSSHGAVSWLLTLCAAAVAVWVVRDAIAALRLPKPDGNGDIQPIRGGQPGRP